MNVESMNETFIKPYVRLYEVTSKLQVKETKTFTRIKLLTKVTRLLTFIAANEHIGV